MPAARRAVREEESVKKSSKVQGFKSSRGRRVQGFKSSRVQGEEEFKGSRVQEFKGLNRQIRRMCQELSYKVVDLKRIRIMNILLDDLKEDTYRDVSKAELEELLISLKGSKN